MDLCCVENVAPGMSHTFAMQIVRFSMFAILSVAIVTASQYDAVHGYHVLFIVGIYFV